MDKSPTGAGVWVDLFELLYGDIMQSNLRMCSQSKWQICRNIVSIYYYPSCLFTCYNRWGFDTDPSVFVVIQSWLQHHFFRYIPSATGTPAPASWCQLMNFISSTAKRMKQGDQLQMLYMVLLWTTQHYNTLSPCLKATLGVKTAFSGVIKTWRRSFLCGFTQTETLLGTSLG